jgi:hypothetical protein
MTFVYPYLLARSRTGNIIFVVLYKSFSKIMLPMLNLAINYGFHWLFLKHTEQFNDVKRFFLFVSFIYETHVPRGSRPCQKRKSVIEMRAITKLTKLHLCSWFSYIDNWTVLKLMYWYFPIWWHFDYRN